MNNENYRLHIKSEYGEEVLKEFDQEMSGQDESLALTVLAGILSHRTKRSPGSGSEIFPTHPVAVRARFDPLQRKLPV